jgi:hypothetical protein
MRLIHVEVFSEPNSAHNNLLRLLGQTIKLCRHVMTFVRAQLILYALISVANLSSFDSLNRKVYFMHAAFFDS